jgi:hypothetical protein
MIAALALLVAANPTMAQWLDRPWPGIPRTPDGRPDLTAPVPRGADGHPDLNGLWSGSPPLLRLTADLLQPWVADLASERQQEYYKTRPTYQCLPGGPEAQLFAGAKRFLHTPAALAILSDDLTYRVIHTDGRELEDYSLPSWMGYSVGRWEGDTLIVDSAGFNDKTWVSRFGVSHTEALRVSERYRRVDFGHLQLEVTFTDPGAFVKPWGFTMSMTLAADSEMLESVCEHSSEDWAGSLSDAVDLSVSVPPEVLARYVGVYTGLYGGRERTYAVSLAEGQLVATIVGVRSGAGLGAPGLDEAAPRPLVARSQTAFEGQGLGYRFVVDDDGQATDLIVIHVSGEYRYPRQR